MTFRKDANYTGGRPRAYQRWWPRRCRRRGRWPRLPPAHRTLPPLRRQPQ
ncbi:hypothetical protein QP028_15015 [Corynebacterium suedekumii]|nr:hypothetical protein QP028_15015 [Corynebacterium suedekumii]